MAILVINADDFGLSDGVCRSIMELFDAGAISSTTLMTAASGALQRIGTWGRTALRGRAGVHLQLTGGYPLSPAHEIPSLIDTVTGRFRDPRKSSLPISPSEVEIEWRRQIEAAHTLIGESPTHLDSHHGMHRRPELFDVYTRLALELGVPVRGATGTLGAAFRARGLNASVAIVRNWSGSGLGPTELMQQVQDVISQNSTETVIEIIVHPGHSDEYLAKVSSLAAEREIEHQALLRLAATGWPRSAGHELCSFEAFSRVTSRA